MVYVFPYSAEFLLQMDKYVRLFHLRKDYLFSRVRLQRMEDIGLDMQRPSLPEILKPGTNFQTKCVSNAKN